MSPCWRGDVYDVACDGGGYLGYDGGDYDGLYD